MNVLSLFDRHGLASTDRDLPSDNLDFSIIRRNTTTERTVN